MLILLALLFAAHTPGRDKKKPWGSASPHGFSLPRLAA
jgi:hypothetical protein